MHTRTRKVTFIEVPGGWLWAEHDRTYRSLSSAVRADNADAKRVADGCGGVVVTQRSFVPNTSLGRTLVDLLVKARRP